MTTKPTHDKQATVNTDWHWLDVHTYPPPLGSKLLLINRAAGVALLGQYTADAWWTHWAPLPTFRD